METQEHSRRWRGPLAAAAVLAGVVAVGSAPVFSGAGRAVAATPLVTCLSGVGSVAFAPGITATSGTVGASGSGTMVGCVASDYPTITKGSFSFHQISGIASCSATGGTGSWTVTSGNPITVTWLNSSGGTVGTSTVTGTAQFSISTVGKITATTGGTVTAGLFSGGSVVLPTTAVTANLADCVLPGGVTGGSATGNGAIY
jgi:hypothetical protein